MWPGEQRKNGCHRFKASSEPFHSLIAQEFSWHFYYRASEAFAPVMERQVGPFAWNVKLQNSQSDPAAPIPVLGQGSFGQTMRKNPCLGFYYFFLSDHQRVISKSSSELEFGYSSIAPITSNYNFSVFSSLNFNGK